MDENYLEELILKRQDINIVKEALVIDRRSLKDRVEDQRENQKVLVLANELLAKWTKQR